MNPATLAHMALSNVRTGNPSMDSLILAGGMYVVANLPAIGGHIVNFLRHFDGKKIKRKNGTTQIVIANMYGGIQSNDKQSSKIFDAVLKKLNDQLLDDNDADIELCPNQRFVPGRSNDRTFVTHPLMGKKNMYNYRGAEIEWIVTAEASENSVILNGRKLFLTMTCMDKKKLLEFVDEANTEYDAFYVQTAWMPNIFNWDVEASKWNCESAEHMKKRSFKTVVLEKHIKKTLESDVLSFMHNKEWFHGMGLDWKRGYLLHGPPGTGKTSVIKAISATIQTDIFNINLANINGDEGLVKAFELLPTKNKFLLVFEDIDCMSSMTHARSKRKPDDFFQNTEFATKPEKIIEPPTLATLLNLLDGVSTSNGRITVMTSNHPEVLDPALIRPGRIDLKMKLGLCNEEMIQEMFELFYPGVEYTPVLPPGKLTPATLSSAFLAHKDDHESAIKYILGLLHK